jgi:hypothetical protein
MVVHQTLHAILGIRPIEIYVIVHKHLRWSRVLTKAGEQFNISPGKEYSIPDLIGIEGLIRGADKVAHERKRHSLFVLKMQKELLEGNATTEAADWDVLLTAAATCHSLKAYKMARQRASLAE